MSVAQVEPARAKVNLTLRVHGRRADGYHELESLVAFAGIADTVALRPTPGEPDRLTVNGPFAGAIAGDNLLTRTMALLRATQPRLSIGAVSLDKKLPVAAGLGGGSADVAALLRLVRAANPESAGIVPWMDIASRLGSDIPVCIASRPTFMQGRGERMSPLPSLPDMHAVMVNPLVPLATASVFAALNAGPAPSGTPERRAPVLANLEDVLGYMRTHGNDLEAVAIGLLPAIAEIKALLSARPGCRIAAMSGSGPTCFGIFADPAAASRAASAIGAARPAWWVEATTLMGVP